MLERARGAVAAPFRRWRAVNRGPQPRCPRRPGRAQRTRRDEPAPVSLFHGVKGAEGGVRAFSVAVVVLLPGLMAAGFKVT